MQIVNLHFELKNFLLPNRKALKLFIHYIFKNEKKNIQNLEIIFCSDNFLLEINEKFLNHSYYTDTITFDLSDEKEYIKGEIYVSVERIKENSKVFKTTFQTELHRVIFHGILHLCNYNDVTTKQKLIISSKERKYLNKYFNIKN